MMNFKDIPIQTKSAQSQIANNILPTPKEIVFHLDKFVKGQTQAKKAIALAFYTHFFQLLSEKGSEFKTIDNFIPQHLLFIGPTGSGKSYLIKKTTEYFNLPCSFFSATSLVQTGYVGLKIDDMIQAHYFHCGKNLDQTQQSVIFLDELDKIKVQRNSDGPDISGEGVQNALLTILDGNDISINASPNNNDTTKIKIDTRGILFVATGSFAAGLANIIRHRIEENHLSDEEILSLVDTEDLIKFGFIPEFIGRFSRIVSLESLKTADLVDILLESQESPLKKHQHLFLLHGIELNFTTSALNILAKQVIQLKTGARSLNRILQKSLLELEYQLPELAQKGVNKITIDEYSLLEGSHNFQYSKKNNTKLLTEIRENFITIKNQSKDKPPILVSNEHQLTNTTGCSNQQIETKLKEVKIKIGWDNTTGSAEKWWNAFETENNHRLGLVLRLSEELLARQATIVEFFLAYVYSNTDNIQANLHYLDYTRLKKEEDKRKKAQAEHK